MKVLQVGNLYSNTGGPALSMYLTMKGLAENGVEVEAYCPQPFEGEEPLGTDVKVTLSSKPRVHLGGYDYIPSAGKDLATLGRFDVIHVQGGWADIYDKAARFAHKNHIPFIMTPRGGLYPQALKSSSWKKKLAMKCFINRDYEQAACVQCTCMEEYEYFRKLGFKAPVAILPNSFETRGVVEKEVPIKKRTVFGYLGRLHPRKRVERLIYAMAEDKAAFADCELKIIGSDVESYEQFLKDEVKRLGLSNVRFTGFLTGEGKDEAIRSLSCLVLPSDYENFGNVVIESLARGVPAIVTKGAPWSVMEDYDCGYWISNDQQTVTKAMKRFAMLSPEEQRTKGLNGQRLVEEKFAVKVVGKLMKELYDWIIGKAEKPSFVYLDSKLGGVIHNFEVDATKVLRTAYDVRWSQERRAAA